jgi:F-type H+-transporting ATPase subunit alpha
VAPAPINAASKQVRTYAADAKASPTEVSSILEQRIRGVQEEAGLAETGRVLSVGCVNNLGYFCGRGTFRMCPLGRLLS